VDVDDIWLTCIFAGKKGGAVGVWDLSDWSKVGYKKLSVFPISSLAVTRDGKYIGMYGFFTHLLGIFYWEPLQLPSIRN
jgi:hypothetical protein